MLLNEMSKGTNSNNRRLQYRCFALLNHARYFFSEGQIRMRRHVFLSHSLTANSATNVCGVSHPDSSCFLKHRHFQARSMQDGRLVAAMGHKKTRTISYVQARLELCSTTRASPHRGTLHV